MNIKSTLKALRKRGVPQDILADLERAASQLPEIDELKLLNILLPHKPTEPQLAGGDDTEQSEWQENFWKDKDWNE